MLAGRFAPSGSSTKNIAVNASFMAAVRASRIGMREIFIALRNELIKSGIVVSREEFGEYHVLLDTTL